MALPIPSERVKAFERKGFGMFIHWGLYSQLGQGEWAQFIAKIPMPEYEQLIHTFTAEDFDAKFIARSAKEAGMKYIVLTARHHEGFSLYDTRGLSTFDVMHSPAKRDLIAEFVGACRAEGLTPFFYHTTKDWHHPDYHKNFDRYLDYLRASVEILCKHYGEIGGFWFDGNWNKPDADWKEDELYGMIQRCQPEAIIINNTGVRQGGVIGHPEIDSVTYERSNPKSMNREGMPKYVAAEMCDTMSNHWGYGRADFHYKSVTDLIERLCDCRKVGANYLLNVGPTAQGGFPKLDAANLEMIGRWMKIHGEPFYSGKPTDITCDGRHFMLKTDDGKFYAFIYHLRIRGHEDVTIMAGGIGPKTFVGVTQQVDSVRWLDNGEELEFQQDLAEKKLTFKATGYPYGMDFVVRIAEITCRM